MDAVIEVSQSPCLDHVDVVLVLIPSRVPFPVLALVLDLSSPATDSILLMLLHQILLLHMHLPHSLVVSLLVVSLLASVAPAFCFD